MARKLNVHENARVLAEPALTVAHYDVIEAHCKAIVAADWSELYSSTCLPIVADDLFAAWLRGYARPHNPPQHGKRYLENQFRTFRKRRWRQWNEWKAENELVKASTDQISMMLSDLLNTDKDNYRDYRVTGARLTDAARPRDRGIVSPLENLGREVRDAHNQPSH